MTGNARDDARMMGSLRSAHGKGVVHFEVRYDTDIADLWDAITNPRRLARWLADVEGDLRLGGEFRARYFATGWEGTGRVEACDPPRRLLVRTRDVEGAELVDEVWLRAEGDQSVLVYEERGMPLDQLAAFGAGNHVLIEDLADYIAGRDRREMGNRWKDVAPAYDALAATAESS